MQEQAKRKRQNISTAARQPQEDVREAWKEFLQRDINYKKKMQKLLTLLLFLSGLLTLMSGLVFVNGQQFNVSKVSCSSKLSEVTNLHRNSENRGGVTGVRKWPILAWVRSVKNHKGFVLLPLPAYTEPIVLFLWPCQAMHFAQFDFDVSPQSWKKRDANNIFHANTTQMNVGKVCLLVIVRECQDYGYSVALFQHSCTSGLLLFSSSFIVD